MKQAVALPFALFAIALAGYLLSSALLASSRERVETAQHKLDQATALESALQRRLALANQGQAGSLLPPEITWPEPDRAAVGLAMQQKLVEAATKVKVTLLSFGLGNTGIMGAFPTVSFDMEMEGGHDEIAAFLLALEEIRPPLATKYLWVRPLPADPARGIVPIHLRMTVWGFVGVGEVSP